MLIVMSGPPGVGKTTVARLVAARIKAAYVRIDTIEQNLRESGASGPIGPEGYLVAYGVAGDNLSLGLAVVADCVNVSDAPRAAWQRVAQQHGHPYLLVQLTCSDPVEHRRRVEVRQADLPGHVLPDWPAVSRIQFPPPPPDALVLDTAHLSPDQAADLVVRRMV